MLEVRFHGRGGQGVVVASKILATAFFLEDRHVQTFPEFGVERRGAPVTAYLRMDAQPIRLRVGVHTPDHVVVLDRSLLGAVDVTSGLRPKGWVLVNAAEAAFDGFRVALVPASEIAAELGIGTRTTPVVNTAIVGAYAKATGAVGLEAIEKAIRESVPAKIEENVRAARVAYERTVISHG